MSKHTSGRSFVESLSVCRGLVAEYCVNEREVETLFYVNGTRFPEAFRYIRRNGISGDDARRYKFFDIVMVLP